MIYHDALSALLAAWIVTFVATTMLTAALEVASVWDPAAYSLALEDAFIAEPLWGRSSLPTAVSRGTHNFSGSLPFQNHEYGFRGGKRGWVHIMAY